MTTTSEPAGRSDERIDPCDPFLRRSAIAAGWSDEQLANGDYRQLFRGVHVSATVPVNLALRARAALVAAPPGSIVSHHTAARLWGGIVPGTSAIHVTIPAGRTFGRDGVIVHRPRELPPAVRRRGVVVTPAARTFVELAAYLPLLDLVVLGDSLVRAGASSPDALHAWAHRAVGRGSRLARRAAGLVRECVDSAPETRLRLLLVLAGLPDPRVDVRLYTEDGRLRYRFDLAYEQVRLAVEYDGAHHDQQRGPDLLRREDLEADGWTFVVVVAAHLDGAPEQVLARVMRAMRRLGMPVPVRLRDEWRRHFSHRERPH